MPSEKFIYKIDQSALPITEIQVKGEVITLFYKDKYEPPVSEKGRNDSAYNYAVNRMYVPQATAKGVKFVYIHNKDKDHIGLHDEKSENAKLVHHHFKLPHKIAFSDIQGLIVQLLELENLPKLPVVAEELTWMLKDLEEQFRTFISDQEEKKQQTSHKVEKEKISIQPTQVARFLNHVSKLAFFSFRDEDYNTSVIARIKTTEDKKEATHIYKKLKLGGTKNIGGKSYFIIPNVNDEKFMEMKTIQKKLRSTN